MTHKKNRLWRYSKNSLFPVVFLVMLISSCNNNPPPTANTEPRDTTVNWGTLTIVYKDSVVQPQKLQQDFEESRQVITRYFDSINKVEGKKYKPQFKVDSAIRNNKWNYLLGINLNLTFMMDSIATPPCRPGPRPSIFGFETLEYSGPCLMADNRNLDK